MKNVKNRRTGRGFTLVELVIVIAVIAVLSAVLIPVFGNIVADAKVAAMRANLTTLNSNLMLRAIKDDNRSSYSADEINEILDEMGFDLEKTPKGYSIWYDQSVNNLRLFKNEDAFSSADPSAAESGIRKAMAAGADIEIGSREIEALNPYNRKLLYIDRTNKEVNGIIKQLKGDKENGGIVAKAEKESTDPADIANKIVNEYNVNLESIAKLLNIDSVSIKTSFDIENTLFIGLKGMYIPAYNTSTQSAPNVICVNSFVDAKVIHIDSQKFDSTKSNANIQIATTIVIPSTVASVRAAVLVELSPAGSKIYVEYVEKTSFEKTEQTGAEIIDSNYSSVVKDDSLKYYGADIVFGRDYSCDYPQNAQYFYMTDSGVASGSLTENQTLADVGSDARIKYLVPVFDILNKGDGFFKNVTEISKLSLSSSKLNGLTKYSAIVILTENGVVKGYKFSNVGYITNLKANTVESYYPINHTGKTDAFPNGKGRIEVSLTDGATSLSNYRDRLSVKVNYKPVVNNYSQEQLMDGTIYYTQKDYSAGSLTTAEAKLVDGKFVLEFDCPTDMTMTGYSTLTGQIESVEVYYTPDLSKPADKKLILVRSYN